MVKVVWTHNGQELIQNQKRGEPEEFLSVMDHAALRDLATALVLSHSMGVSSVCAPS